MADDRPVLVLIDGNERLLSLSDVLQKVGSGEATSVIRIADSEYADINFDTSFESGYYGHFNLGMAGHKAGVTYALPRIVRNGIKSETREVQPLLSFKDTHVGECIAVEAGIPFDEVDSEKFKYSMKHIKTIEQLKNTILSRYAKSRPALSREEMLAMGVTFTLLKFKEKVDDVLL